MKKLKLLKILIYYWKVSVKQLKIKQKNKGGFLDMLLSSILLWNMLAGAKVMSQGRVVLSADR